MSVFLCLVLIHNKDDDNFYLKLVLSSKSIEAIALAFW